MISKTKRRKIYRDVDQIIKSNKYLSKLSIKKEIIVHKVVSDSNFRRVYKDDTYRLYYDDKKFLLKISILTSPYDILEDDLKNILL